MSAAEMREAHVDSVRFLYTNWRGETAIRRAVPICLEWRATEHHPEPQWIMRALDLDKNASRDFALRDCDFRAPLPDEKGMVERVAEALFAEIAAQAEQEGSMGWVSNTEGEWIIDGTFDGSALARAALRAINGGKP